MDRRPGGSAGGRSYQGLASALLPALLLLGAALSFAPVVGGFWLADDFDWVRDFQRYPWHDVPNLFRGDWSRAAANEYRPLWALSFILDLRLWGPTAAALHVTNIALHVIASALVWRLAAGARGGSRGTASLALAFFVLAPIHDEPVAWIAARGHVLAPIFILAAALLLRRFERGGGLGLYLASIGAALAALATQEVAVALPALLLLGSVAESPWPSRDRLLRLVAVHAPFWGLLGAYLGLRVSIFGQLGRDSAVSSGADLARAAYLSVRTVWGSPASLPLTPTALTSVWGKALLFLLISAFLLAPFGFLPRHQILDYGRGILYFAAGWPVIASAVLLGANSDRHFYLASVGPAIALGLAAAHWLTAKRPLTIVGVGVTAALLGLYGFALGAGIAEFARNGERSHQLQHAADTAIAGAREEPSALVVILAQSPDNQRVLWDYFYPTALSPPFTARGPAVDVLPDFATCHCSPEEWLATHGAPLARLAQGNVDSIHLVEWDPQQDAFVPRVLDLAAFRNAGYLTSTGPLLRPRYPGTPAPQPPTPTNVTVPATSAPAIPTGPLRPRGSPRPPWRVPTRAGEGIPLATARAWSRVASSSRSRRARVVLFAPPFRRAWSRSVALAGSWA
jgi:hypothetical protein